MIIGKSLLDTLSSRAKSSPRFRQNFDLRNSENDNSLRMMNAWELGMVLYESKD